MSIGKLPKVNETQRLFWKIKNFPFIFFLYEFKRVSFDDFVVVRFFFEYFFKIFFFNRSHWIPLFQAIEFEFLKQNAVDSSAVKFLFCLF